MAREKITVLIPCGNEEKNLPDLLKTVAWADEIFVVDSFSKDRSAEIARAAGARVVQHEYVNSAAQKNWAIPQCSHPWVLIVDCDERVTPALREEVLQKLEGDHPFDGFRIFRANRFMGRRIRFCGWQDDSCLRLFRRDKGRYQEREVHADIVLDGRVGVLKNKLLHFTFASFDQYMKKFDQYTTWAAGDRAKRTKRVRWHHLTLRPAWRFFRQYVIKLGFLDGLPGLIICSLAAYSVFLKYSKLWERRAKEEIHHRGTESTEKETTTKQ
ncbi:MAG: glycosyltransferase family 2 protein [bacterium]